MQRLHEHDLCGYLQEIEPEEWTALSLPCIWHDENGCEQPLWEFKHTLEELHKIERSNSFVFETQYMQNPKPLEGMMYGEFKTYDIIPYAASMRRKNYTDTADTGSDYLCSICYTETPIGNFVTDILYTQKPMEYTEPATAEMLSRNRTEICYVESNNGGRSFGRNVEAQCRIMGNAFTSFCPFTQTDNKRCASSRDRTRCRTSFIFRPDGNTNGRSSPLMSNHTVSSRSSTAMTTPKMP